MNQFIAQCRVMLLAGKITRVVLGNPTADMDSCLGSVLLAYYYSSENINTAPIINYGKEQFRSHFEIGNILMDPIFINEVDLNKYEIVLFDHNDYQHPNIVGCVDHHEDKENQFKFKTIEKVGSATTLVARLLMMKHLIDKEISGLIMQTLLVDTFNFDQKQKTIRWVDLDWEVFQHCQTIYPEFNREQEYDNLMNLKYNVDANLKLSLQDMLFKDYKVFNYNGFTIGYAVLFIKISILLNKYPINELSDGLLQFISDNKLNQLVIMFAILEDGIVKRQIMLIGQNVDRSAKALSVLCLQVQDSAIVNSRYFIDVNNMYSRKIIEPLLAQEY